MAEESTQTKSSYHSIVHIVQSRITCKSLYSDTKDIMTDTRRKMDPSTLEMLLVLEYNKNGWGLL